MFFSKKKIKVDKIVLSSRPKWGYLWLCTKLSTPTPDRHMMRGRGGRGRGRARGRGFQAGTQM